MFEQYNHQHWEVVVESKPCGVTFVRKKYKQAQVLVADLQPMSVENIQLNLKQRVITKVERGTGCSLLPDGGMVFSCLDTDTVSVSNKDGAELFQIISKDTTGFTIYDTVLVFILKIIIALLYHLDGEVIDEMYNYGRHRK